MVKGLEQKTLVPFADWPAEGHTYEHTSAPRLLKHFRGALTVLDVSFGVGGYDFKDVHT